MNNHEIHIDDTEKDVTQPDNQSFDTIRGTSHGPRYSPRIFNRWDLDEMVADFRARYAVIE
jgi:hypothetical protein